MAILDILQKEQALELKLACIKNDIAFIEDCLSDNSHFGLSPEEKERAPILLSELKVNEMQLMHKLDEVREEIHILFGRIAHFHYDEDIARTIYERMKYER